MTYDKKFSKWETLVKKAQRGELSMPTPPTAQVTTSYSQPVPPPPPPLQTAPPPPPPVQSNSQMQTGYSAYGPASAQQSYGQHNTANNSYDYIGNNPNKKSSTKLPLIIGCVGIGILVAGALGYFMLNNKNSDTDVAKTEIVSEGIATENPDIVKEDIDAEDADKQESQELIDAATSRETEQSPDEIVANAMKNMEPADHGDLEGMYPQASERLLTDDDLCGMGKYDLKIMRNEIFARHGYIFKTKDMKEHFEHEYWYLGQYDDVTSKLTSIEKKNIELIKKYENK